MVIAEHHPIADTYIQDPRPGREVIQTVIIAEVCYIIYNELIEIVFHRNVLGCLFVGFGGLRVEH